MRTRRYSSDLRSNYDKSISSYSEHQPRPHSTDESDLTHWGVVTARKGALPKIGSQLAPSSRTPRASQGTTWTQIGSAIARVTQPATL